MKKVRKTEIESIIHICLFKEVLGHLHNGNVNKLSLMANNSWNHKKINPGFSENLG